MTHITFPCACGRTLRVKAEHGGKRTRCPGCQQSVLIPPLQEQSHRSRPVKVPERGIQAERPSPRSRPHRPEGEELPVAQPADAEDDLPEAEPAPRRRRRRRRSSGGGWSPSFSMDPAGGAVLGGLAMMLGAAVWFVAGLAVGIIFFYPPILFIIGVATFIGGVNGQR